MENNVLPRHLPDGPREHLLGLLAFARRRGSDRMSRLARLVLQGLTLDKCVRADLECAPLLRRARRRVPSLVPREISAGTEELLRFPGRDADAGAG